MPDKLTPEQRHKCMSHIRGKDTKPELMVRKYLYAHGYRYRLHEKRLPGKPDIVMRRLHTVIMVNGCFWHGHILDTGEHCKLYVTPKSRSDFWQAKILRNQQRDLRDREALTHLGWNVIQIWECQLKSECRQETLQSLLFTLSQIELNTIEKKANVRPYSFEEDTLPISMAADDNDVDN